MGVSKRLAELYCLLEKNEMTKENIAYFKRDEVDKMDIKSDLKKKRMCIAVAKYYIKIFQCSRG